MFGSCVNGYEIESYLSQIFLLLVHMLQKLSSSSSSSSLLLLF